MQFSCLHAKLIISNSSFVFPSPSRANFGDLEIEMFFAKYDRHGDGLNMGDAEEIFEDIDMGQDIDELDEDVMGDDDGEDQGGVSLGKQVTEDDMLG